ncbi:hypothetical protein [Denitrobaculum tricleocarpae]|uniref:Uncharacterized protein n=1 Tax=Denitrobaculum tricleocarpae TaxID=2591009 RepID=A0A545TSY8_9PROT|nr:hypothetical protein [Denitrobaculum tricleocarpae]TQV80328.1 hypothetical protein FKG95_09035 [Denitrobaculum tricleocarpae]
MTADFPIKIENQAGQFFLNQHCWKTVTCKNAVKATVNTILDQPNLYITGLSVAKTGTVYIEVQSGQYDPDYKLFGDGDVFNIRISDHESAYGAYSHDGRTDNYTDPDFEVSKTAFMSEVEALVESAREYFEDAAEINATLAKALNK